MLVVGGGLAGLAFTSLLGRAAEARRPGLRIGILDREPPRPPPADAGIGLRVLAIAPTSRAILAHCGAWQQLPAGRAAPYRRMRVWQAAGSAFGPGSIGFDAADEGLAELGHIVENDWLRLLLWQSLESVASVEIVAGETPVAFQSTPAETRISVASGATLAAKLIVGADGVDSWVRTQLGLRTSGHEYGQQALVAHVTSERAHEQTAWQCFQPGGPVALLPLADGRSSVVWSCPDDVAGDLLRCDEAEFGARLTAATGAVLGELRVTTRRAAFPLAARHTHHYTGPRFALIGDAAHQIHPLAGQGINLGLLDAAALAETIEAHLAATRFADPGDLRPLRRYERWRKGANLLTQGAMEGLHRLFSSAWEPAPRLGALGLGAIDRLPGVKRLLAARALGHAGRLPRSAR